ncbi:hypothetical protein [Actinomyces oris]
MSDHDATQPPTSGSPRPNQGDEFNARTVLINQDMLDAARAEQQAPGQAPGAVPGAAPGAQAGSWRPAQPDLPAGPPPEEQTRAFSTGAAQAAAQPGAAPADPYIQANPYAQQSGLGQPSQPGQPAQPAWGGSTAADGAAPVSSPFAQSAPGIPSAPGTSSAPAAGAAPGAATSRETPHWPGQQPQAQTAGLPDQQPFAQQPAPQSHPFSGGRQEGEVGMSSVFPTATARAEAEQATEAFVPAATQAVAQSAPSSSSAFPSQSSAPQWGSAPSSDAAAGQAPSFSDMVPPAAGSPFERPAEGGALAVARSEEAETADSVGSWMLTMLLAGIPLLGLAYVLYLAFGSGRSASKKNWARATLVWGIIGSVLVLVLYAALGASVLGMVPSNAG